MNREDYNWELVNILIYSTKHSEIMSWTMESKICYVMIYYETKSFKIVQARYKRKFSFKTSPNRSQIFRLVKNFEAHDTCEDLKAMGPSPSGPPITHFTRHIQRFHQPNGGHLKHVL